MSASEQRSPSIAGPTNRPLLNGWHWRLLGWAVAVCVLGSIGYVVIVLITALLESGAL